MDKAATPSKANKRAWTDAKDDVKNLEEWIVKGRAKGQSVATVLDPRNVVKGKKEDKNN